MPDLEIVKLARAKFIGKSILFVCGLPILLGGKHQETMFRVMRLDLG